MNQALNPQYPVSLAGVFPPIPTPFDERGEVDHAALADNLQRWNEYDLAGYVVLGSNGEFPLCSREEKVSIWATARKVIPPGKLLIAGTGAESTTETVALTRLAAEAGADVALAVTPHYFGGMMTSEALLRHYEVLAHASPIPVMIYNVPKFTGVDMAADAIARSGQHPNLIGLKETGGNIAKMADTVRLADPGFQMLVGSAGFFFAGLAVGAVGGILALSNLAPAQCIEIYRLFHDGRWDEAAMLQRRMLPVNAAVTSRFGIPGLKAALEMLGYYGGPVRMPLQELTGEQRGMVRDILVEGGVLV
jgi:4-hydroxy-2-oxoglutarate aldolase